MTIELASVLITAAVSIGGAWPVARVAGKKADLAERESDRNEMTRLRGEITKLWNARENDAKTKYARGSHIAVLEAHIWQDKGPPPPPHPENV